MASQCEMTDAHRLFLQSFMSKGLLNSKEVTSLHKYAVNERFQGQGEVQVADFVKTINMNIKPFHMEIKKGFHEDNGLSCYVLVTTTGSDITRFASDYSSTEILYLEKLFFSIVESDTGLLGLIDALGLTAELQGMKQGDAEQLIKRMEDDRWLTINSKGAVGLSIRTILELDNYIRSTFKDCPIQCQVCHRICIQGQICTKCDCKLHNHCAARLFQKKSKPSCPSCKHPWQHSSTKANGQTVDSPENSDAERESEPQSSGHRKRTR